LRNFLIVRTASRAKVALPGFAKDQLHPPLANSADKPQADYG
jgi:hypothetical protein